MFPVLFVNFQPARRECSRRFQSLHVVQMRLNVYQIGDPERSYKSVFSHKTHLFRETESHIHDYFDNKHEWVRADLNDINKRFSTM